LDRTVSLGVQCYAKQHCFILNIVIWLSLELHFARFVDSITNRS